MDTMSRRDGFSKEEAPGSFEFFEYFYDTPCIRSFLLSSTLFVLHLCYSIGARLGGVLRGLERR
jgi:hypothetical protein